MKQRDTLEGLEVDGRIILKRTLKNKMRRQLIFYLMILTSGGLLQKTIKNIRD